MTSRRYGAAGISHAQSFIFFGGNELDGSGKWVRLNSTEILTEQGVSAGPEMPEAVSRHAIAVVNETTFILTGGYTGGPRPALGGFWWYGTSVFGAVWAAGPVLKKKLGADYEHLLSFFFHVFRGKKKNIVASALKSYIK